MCVTSVPSGNFDYPPGYHTGNFSLLTESTDLWPIGWLASLGKLFADILAKIFGYKLGSRSVISGAAGLLYCMSRKEVACVVCFC